MSVVTDVLLWLSWGVFIKLTNKYFENSFSSYRQRSEFALILCLAGGNAASNYLKTLLP